jgi:uncharacterized protein YyaL (SSP411 family)
MREMLDPAGGFYSTQDADSESEEGKFFVWTPDEIREILGGEFDTFTAAYGVTRHGNFEGKNIPEFVGEMEQRPTLAEARRALFEERERRVHPGRDEKVLTSWNGLMLAAFAEAARFLDRDDGSRALAASYRLVAERNTEFLLRGLRQENGRLLHSWKEGDARLNGYLEDYSYLIEGLLELYQTTFEPCWFLAAQELAETMLAHFQAPGGGFFDTSDDHETPVTRPRDLQDNATPSGNAMAVTVLLKLAGFTNELRTVDTAHQALAEMQPMICRYPLGFGRWLQALAYALSGPREIAIIGDPENAGTQALLNVVRGGYRPFQVVALGGPNAHPSDVPLLRNRGLVEGQGEHARPAAYVSRAFACQAPVTDPLVLEQLLGVNTENAQPFCCRDICITMPGKPRPSPPPAAWPSSAQVRCGHSASQTLKPSPPESAPHAQEPVREPKPGGPLRRIPGQRFGHFPDGHLGFDVQLSERPGH